MGNIDLKNVMKLSNEFLGNIRKEWCLMHLSIHIISYSCNKKVIKLQIGSNRPLKLDLVKMVFWLFFFFWSFFFSCNYRKVSSLSPVASHLSSLEKSCVRWYHGSYHQRISPSTNRKSSAIAQSVTIEALYVKIVIW